MAFPNEVLELVAAAAGILDRHIVGGAVSPVDPALVFGKRHQFDGVDPEIDEVGNQVDRILKSAALIMPGAQAVDVELIDHQVLYPGRHWAPGFELVAPEFVLGQPVGLGEARRAEGRGHEFRIDDHGTALRPVEILAPSAPLRVLGWVDAAAADLAAGIEVAAVGDLTVVLGDAEHVEGVAPWPELGEIPGVGCVGAPHAVALAVHGDSRAYPAIIV